MCFIHFPNWNLEDLPGLPGMPRCPVTSGVGSLVRLPPMCPWTAWKVQRNQPTKADQEISNLKVVEGALEGAVRVLGTPASCYSFLWRALHRIVARRVSQGCSQKISVLLWCMYLEKASFFDIRPSKLVSLLRSLVFEFRSAVCDGLWMFKFPSTYAPFCAQEWNPEDAWIWPRCFMITKATIADLSLVIVCNILRFVSRVPILSWKSPRFNTKRHCVLHNQQHCGLLEPWSDCR